MRVLGIDLGSRRIGLAVSDPERRVALPAGILESRGRRRDLLAIQELVRERGVERVVVGLPVHMDGRVGPEAQAARRFASELAELVQLPVDTLDERWTSREAERVLASGGRSAQRRRGAVDELAATILLRTYLEREARRPPEAPAR